MFPLDASNQIVILAITDVDQEFSLYLRIYAYSTVTVQHSSAHSNIYLRKAVFQVVVNYVSSADAAESVAEEISAAGGQAFVVGADVGKKEDIDNMFTAVKDHWGGVDVLVNNAGTELTFSQLG